MEDEMNQEFYQEYSPSPYDVPTEYESERKHSSNEYSTTDSDSDFRY